MNASITARGGGGCSGFHWNARIDDVSGCAAGGNCDSASSAGAPDAGAVVGVGSGGGGSTGVNAAVGDAD